MNYKEILKGIKISIILIVISALIGTGLLFLVTKIPQRYLKKYAKNAAEVLYKEGTYPNTFGEKRGHRLDNFTDGLMINTAYTSTGKWIEDTLQATHTRYKQKKDPKKSDNPMISFYRYIVKNDDGKFVNRYPRFWHGYLVYLRPLLAMIPFSAIRGLNMVLQISAILLVLYGLIKRGLDYLCVPFIVMWISLSPATLFSSIAYMAGFYSTMFASILLVWMSDKLNILGKGIIFELTGIVLAYFDFLMFSSICLGIPLILYFSIDSKREICLYERIKELIVYTSFWGIGYGGMWASKWIIASLFTGQNIILNAYRAILIRSSHANGKTQYTWLGVLKANLNHLGTAPVIVAILIAIIIFIIIFLKNNKRIYKNIPVCCCILIVCLHPFIWYAIAMNHSGVHHWMTYRLLVITIYGLISILFISLGRYCRSINEGQSENV